MTRTRRSSTDEFKREAVKLCKQSGVCVWRFLFNASSGHGILRIGSLVHEVSGHCTSKPLLSEPRLVSLAGLLRSNRHASG